MELTWPTGADGHSWPSVLFVCTGNICRSPTAHALLLHKAHLRGHRLRVDSAGISDEEAGRPMDPRSAKVLRERGIPALSHRARQVREADFENFDLLLGMTHRHCEALRRQLSRLSPQGRALARVAHILDVLPHRRGEDVPDPWYGHAAGFDQVFDLLDEAVDAWLSTWSPVA